MRLKLKDCGGKDSTSGVLVARQANCLVIAEDPTGEHRAIPFSCIVNEEAEARDAPKPDKPT